MVFVILGRRSDWVGVSVGVVVRPVSAADGGQT
jgi:hypothetical protein